MFIEVGYFDFLTVPLFVLIYNKIMLIYIFESFHRRGVNMSLNMHGTQHGLSQHRTILQDIKV